MTTATTISREIDSLFIQSSIETIKRLKYKDDPRRCILRALDELNFILQDSIEYDYDDLDDDVKVRIKEIIQIVYEFNKERINNIFKEG